MAGLGIRLFTDEMISPDLAVGLRRQGYDVVSCDESGRSRQRMSDDQQLLYASSVGRAVLTFNARDYVAIDRRWKDEGRHHAGIIVSQQVNDLGEPFRRVKWHLDVVKPGVQDDVLLWLRANEVA